MSGFWELGLFAAGASGSYTLHPEANTPDATGSVDKSLGRALVDSNAKYTYGILGVRGRMHLLRTKSFDGWFGVDVGAWYLFLGARSMPRISSRDRSRREPSSPTSSAQSGSST